MTATTARYTLEVRKQFIAQDISRIDAEAE
jgi:hypothetical protein